MSHERKRASIKVFANEPLIKRLPQQIDRTKGITTYDLDNLYPQKVEEIKARSPLTNSSVNVLTDFINGDGWSENSETRLNEEGQNSNDVLLELSQDFSTFQGFALHFNFNVFGRITEVNPVAFTFCRFGEPDEFGRHHDIKVSNNWEKDSKKLPQGNTQTVLTFPVFNPKNIFKEFMLFGGVENHPGQILYWTPQRDIYPRCSFDAVLDAAQTDSEILLFELSNIQNGFLGSTVFRYPSTFESEAEKRELQKEISQLKGAYNANAIMLTEVPEDFAGTLIEPIPALNNDTLFQQTGNHVRDVIVQNFAMPPALLGVMPESGVFTQQAIEDSYIYYNLRTRNMRNVLARVFKAFGLLWHKGPLDFGEILEQNFQANNSSMEAALAFFKPTPPS